VHLLQHVRQRDPGQARRLKAIEADLKRDARRQESGHAGKSAAQSLQLAAAMRKYRVALSNGRDTVPSFRRVARLIDQISGRCGLPNWRNANAYEASGP
jgi:hypothetical protein